MKNSLAERIKDWEKKDAELDNRMALFENQYKHTKPCKRYIQTGYCLHLVNAQQRNFGKEANSLVADLVAIAKK